MSAKSINKLYISWRKCSRQLYQLLYGTHNNLLRLFSKGWPMKGVDESTITLCEYLNMWCLIGKAPTHLYVYPRNYVCQEASHLRVKQSITLCQYIVKIKFNYTFMTLGQS